MVTNADIQYLCTHNVGSRVQFIRADLYTFIALFRSRVTIITIYSLHYIQRCWVMEIVTIGLELWVYVGKGVTKQDTIGCGPHYQPY